MFYRGFVERWRKGASDRTMMWSRWRRAACGWAQAKQNGLVDEIGGLDRAVEMVKQRAKIPASEQITLVTYPPRRTLLEMLLKSSTTIPSWNRRSRQSPGICPGNR